MSTSEWRSYNGGKRWRTLEDGFIEVEGEGVTRTRGEPSTMRAFWSAHKIAMMHYSDRFEVPLAWIMGLAGIECAAFRFKRKLDPDTSSRSPHIDTNKVRWESHINDYSNSPWQILTGTASDRNRSLELVRGGGRVYVDDLAVPEIACGLSTAHMRHLLDGSRTPDAPDYVHLQAAWNAGRVRAMEVTDERPWGMRTYGEDRTGNAIKWHNDAVAVLREEGITCGGY